VLMPQTVIAQALAKAEQFRSALAAELIEPLLKPVTSSFGVAELASGEDAESFLGRIDTALYRAKEADATKSSRPTPRSVRHSCNHSHSARQSMETRMSSLFWWLGRDSNSRPRHYELIADARFANALPQFVSDQLPLVRTGDIRFTNRCTSLARSC